MGFYYLFYVKLNIKDDLIKINKVISYKLYVIYLLLPPPPDEPPEGLPPDGLLEPIELDLTVAGLLEPRFTEEPLGLLGLLIEPPELLGLVGLEPGPTPEPWFPPWFPPGPTPEP